MPAFFQKRTDMDERKPKVGVGVMVMKEGKVLLGKRKNAHGAGEYAFPGGHLEYMETITACAIRETQEESGIFIQNIRFQLVATVTAYTPKHYVHINVLADWKSGEPQVLEPEKCESWGWFDINNLPQPLFATIPTSIDSFKTGKNFFDA